MVSFGLFIVVVILFSPSVNFSTCFIFHSPPKNPHCSASRCFTMQCPPCSSHDYVEADSNGKFLCIVVVIHLPPCPYLFTFHFSIKMSTHHWGPSPLSLQTLCNDIPSLTWLLINTSSKQTVSFKLLLILSPLAHVQFSTHIIFHLKPHSSDTLSCHSFPRWAANISLLCHCLPHKVYWILNNKLFFSMKLILVLLGLYLCTLTKCHSWHT